MKNTYWLLLFIFLFACHTQKAIIVIEDNADVIEGKPIEKDAIIDAEYEPTFAEFEVDSQHVIFRQFETHSDPNIYYKKTDKAPVIDTIAFSGKYLKLGKIVHHRKVVVSIPIINTGKYPMVIRHCKSSGGGMLAYCQKEPIFPNDTSYVDIVIYTKSMIGKSTKTATLSTNTKEEMHRFMIQWEYVAGE